MGLQDLINKYDNGGFSKTGWFQLKDDGDTATVRLLHKGEVGVKDGETDYDFPIYEVHKLDVDGSGRDRTCLCKGESCEFCKSGNKPQLRMFLQMINKDEKDKVAPLVGARIEICSSACLRSSSVSLPSWERGLKCFDTLNKHFSNSRSPRGSED